jgi:hypothetical protein
VHHSAGTVQAGSVGADPATAVSAPVNANAPACVAATCPGGDSGQAAGGWTATGSPASANEPGQTATGSLGTVQLGWFELAPRTGVSTPVAANAPVCLLASCPSAESGGRDRSPSGGPTTVTPAVVSAVIVPVPASTSVQQAGKPAPTQPANPKENTPRTGVLGSGGSTHAHDPSLFPLGAVIVRGMLPYTGLALPGFLLAAIAFLAAGGAVRLRTLV